MIKKPLFPILVLVALATSAAAQQQRPGTQPAAPRPTPTPTATAPATGAPAGAQANVPLPTSETSAARASRPATFHTSRTRASARRTHGALASECRERPLDHLIGRSQADAEVGRRIHHAARQDEDVLRVHVAVNDSLQVRSGQRRAVPGARAARLVARRLGRQRRPGQRALDRRRRRDVRRRAARRRVRGPGHR